MYMFKQLIFSFFTLLFCLHINSTEFRFASELDSKTGINTVRLFLSNDTNDTIQISCNSSNEIEGPYISIDLNEKPQEVSTMFYRVNQGPIEYFMSFQENDLISIYPADDFAWIEDFLQSLETVEILTMGRTKSLREAKFKNPKNRENLTKFFEAAKNLDSCRIRTSEDEVKESQQMAKAEAEKKRIEAERSKKEAETKEKKAQDQANLYAEFRSDISRIIKKHYALELGNANQELYSRFINEWTKEMDDGICWGTGLYQFALNKDEASYDSLKEIKSEHNGADAYWYFNEGLWSLSLNVDHITNNETVTLKAMSEEKQFYAQDDLDYESQHCINLDLVRRSYGFDDLDSAEFKNVASKIGEQYIQRSRFDIKEVASLFNKLEFEVKIAGFDIDPQFNNLSNGFYEKWGKSEYIKIVQGSSIRERKLKFLNSEGKLTPIKLNFIIDPYDYEISGTIRFEDNDFDWSAW